MDEKETTAAAEKIEGADESAEQSKLVKLLMFSVPALLLLVCVLIIGIARAMRSSAPAATAPAEEENPLLDCNHSMPLPFGMKARNQCIASCYGPGIDREVCTRGCDKLISAEFARRVTLDERTEGQIAAEIAEGCAQIAAAGSKTQPLEEWTAAAKKAVRTFGETPVGIDVYEYKSAIEHYGVFKQLEREAAFPAGEEPAAREMAVHIRKAICLRQSIAATELAIAEIADSFDFHSERFYRVLEAHLVGLSHDSELAVMNAYGTVLHPQPEAQG